MRFRLGGSLSARLTLIGLASSILCVVLVAAAGTAYELVQFRESLSEELRSISDIFILNNTAALRFGDSQAASENLSALKADPHIVSACLYDRDARLFAAYGRPGVANRCPPATPRAAGPVFHGSYASYFAPILLDGESLGAISLSHDFGEVRERLGRSAFILAATLASALLFAMWLSSRMVRAIARPIAALAGTSRRVSEERNYSLRVLDSGWPDSELRILVDSFNHMLSKVEQSDRELASHRERLEEQVAARTTDLLNLNRHLTSELEARRVAESALRESEERYALAMNGANDGLWDWDLKTGKIYFSARWKAMLGFSGEEIGDQPLEWLGRAHPADAARLGAAIEDHCLGRTAELQIECRMRHKDEGYRWMLSRGLAIRGEDGKATRMAGSQTDITEAKVSDPLTGLPNRILFTDRLARSIQLNLRDPASVFAVLFLDLDRFKIVNDSLGHLAGDKLLVGIAHRLSASLHSADLAVRLPGPSTVARLGGDEFAVLLEQIQTVDNARNVADRILRDVSLPFHLDGRPFFTTVSIGVALSQGQYRWPEEILRDADTAMYAAKASGKARYAVFDAAMGTRAVARLEIETDLRSALGSGELTLHYQPEIALTTGEIVGFEALVRWRHPRRGLIAPVEFIPIAEETGLIAPLGAWVLDRACRQMRQWQFDFPDLSRLHMSVNLSGVQFASKDLVPIVRQALAASELPANCLDLEITESVLMEDTEAAIRTLLDLKRLGLGLQIDDFGTGYSSLSYLHRLPFDTLKIDRSFVASIGADAAAGASDDGLEIVRTIMALAQSLRLRVVAEGIENQLQLAYLRDLGCEYGQGYLFSKPLDASRVWNLLSSRSTNQPQAPEVVLTG